MKTPSNTVVVAAADGQSSCNTNQIRSLLRHLSEEGFDPEVLLLEGGAHLDGLRAVARASVVDELRRRGIGRVTEVIRQLGGRTSPTPRRVRVRLEQAMVHPWIVCSPEVTGLFGETDLRPPALVALLIDPATKVGHFGPTETAQRSGFNMWLTLTTNQAQEVRGSGVDSAVHAVGSLWEPHRDRSPLPASGPREPVLLSTPSKSWTNPCHAVEIVAALSDRAPDAPLVWLADSAEDQWLANHDLAHLKMRTPSRVRVQLRGTDLRSRPRMILRTGYQASDPGLVLAAAHAQIPTVGFDLSDLPDCAGNTIAPFGVEQFVDEAVTLLEEDRRKRRGAELASAVSRRPSTHERLEPLFRFLDTATARASK